MVLGHENPSPFTEDERLVLHIIVASEAVLGGLASLFIIISSCVFPVKVTGSVFARLVVRLALACLAAAAIGFSLGIDAGDPSSPDYPMGWCVFQAAAVHSANLAMFVMTFSLAFTLRQIVLNHKDPVEAENYVWPFTFLAVVIPAGSTTSLLLMEKFGPSGEWCWIADPTDPHRFIQFYFPLAGLIVYCSWSFYSIRYRVRRILARLGELSPAQVKLQSRVARKLTLYPLAFVICWVPGIVNRTYEYFRPDDPSFVLYVLEFLTVPLYPLANCIVYGLTEELVGRYKGMWVRWRRREPLPEKDFTPAQSGSIGRWGGTQAQPLIDP